MKPRLVKSIATLLVAITSVYAVSPIAHAKENEVYGEVKVERKGNIIKIGNDSIERIFDISNKKLSTKEIKNLLGNSTFVPQTGSEEFFIQSLVELNRVEPENELTSIKPKQSQNSQSGWKIEGNSVSKQEGKGYSALIDGDLESHYHSNYGTGEGEVSKLPVKLTLDRGEDAQNTPFQTFGYRPRLEGETANGNVEKYKLYVSDDKDSLFKTESLKKEGEFQYTGAYDESGKPKFIYTSFDEVQNGRYIGFEVISSKGQNKHAAGTEIDLYKEKFDSIPESTAPVIKTSDLELEKTDVSKTEATINGVAKKGQMITFSFKPITFGTGKLQVTEKVVMYDGDHFMRKFIELDSSDKNIRIDYIDGEHFVTKEEDKKWTIPTNKGGVVQMDATKANLGQPIYVNGLFVGSEFPATDTQIVDGLGRMRYFTGKNFEDFKRDGQLSKTGKYVSWQTVLGATHSNGDNRNVIQQDFFKYIDSIATPSEFRIQYNSWFDNMMRITDENIISSFYAVDKHLSNTGVRPLDSYVVDDGWNIYRKAKGELNSQVDIERNGKDDVNEDGFWTFNSKFPNELTPSSQLVQNFGSNFGVWIGPRGGYNYYGDLATIIEKAGNGSKAGGSIDVADDRYVKKFEEMAIDWMKRFKVNYWKWDGFADTAQFNAFPQGKGVVGYDEEHHHMYGGENGMYHVTDLWEKWISLMKNVRLAEKEYNIENLWISLTCYVNPSPWYLQWANSVWLQCVADRGERTNGNSNLNNKMDTMLTYRDGAYYDFIVNHEFQFPLANIYNHDPIYGKEGTGITANSMNGDQFRNYLFMQGTRGTAFWELYYSDSIFDEEKYLINADFLEWAEANFSKLRNAKMIGETPSSTATLTGSPTGDAGTQEAYGFSCFDGDEGIISMRNPAAVEKTITFRLDDAIGATVEGDYYKTIEQAYSVEGKLGASKDMYKKGEEISVTLQPGETQIWNLSKTKDTIAPTLTKVFAKDDKTLQVSASEHLMADDINFEVKVNGKVVNAEVEKVADLRTFNLTLDSAMQDGAKVEVKATKACDMAKNELNDTSSYTYYSNYIIAQKESVAKEEVISKADRSVSGKDGFSVSASVKTDEKNIAVVKQGDSYELGIDKDGHPYFVLNGVKATSSSVVSSKYETVISGVKENNGLIKVYVNGNVSGSAYDVKNINFNVEKADIYAKNATDVKVFSRSLGYDEVPTSTLAELVKKLNAEKQLYSVDSWNAANMDELLKSAEEALKNEGANLQEAYDALFNGYKKLIPIKEMNLSLGKEVSAAWLDADDKTQVDNSGSPLSNAVNGKIDVNSYAIFGKDKHRKPSYITVDLGEVVEINSVELYRYWADNRTYDSTALVVSEREDFEDKTVLFYASDDKNNDIFKLGEKPSQDLYQESESGKVLFDHNNEVALRNSDSVKARYVRLYGTGVKNGGDENHIVELKVNGVPNDFDPYDLASLKEVIEKAEKEMLNTIYTADSIEALKAEVETAKTVVSEVEKGTQKDKTLGYVLDAKQNLEDKLTALKVKEADYSKVDRAIAKANALNPKDYKDFSGVEKAIKAVVRGLDITEQAKVDKMAESIENAIAALVKVDIKPTEPNKPSEPSENDEKPNDLNDKYVQTGDTTNGVVWILLVLGAATILIGCTCKKKQA